MPAALALIAQYLSLLPILIQAGISIENVAKEIFAVANQPGGPTPEQWTTLHNHENAARAILDQRAADAQKFIAGG